MAGEELGTAFANGIQTAAPDWNQYLAWLKANGGAVPEQPMAESWSPETGATLEPAGPSQATLPADTGGVAASMVTDSPTYGLGTGDWLKYREQVKQGGVPDREGPIRPLPTPAELAQGTQPIVPPDDGRPSWQAAARAPSEVSRDAQVSALRMQGVPQDVAEEGGGASAFATEMAPGTGTALAGADTAYHLGRGEYGGAALSGLGIAPAGKVVGNIAQRGIKGAGKVIGKLGKEVGEVADFEAARERLTRGRTTGDVAAEAVTQPTPGIGHNRPPAEVTGSLNPLDNVDVTFNGKPLKDLTPEELQAFGEHYGVKNLGPLSPLQTYKDMTGKEFQLPGGTAGNWTYADTLHMKANPINPANVDRGLHAEMQRKLGRTMTPEELTDADVWNGLLFGMTSPNNPLFPNQATASRLRLRTPQMLDDLGGMIPWKAGDTTITKEVRKAANDAIAHKYSLDAASKGGLGTRGTADYSRVAEMAQLFKQDPQFFRKQPTESWSQAVERISSQLPGLSMKTGSFGTVWQDPANAAISAIDRHMARELDKQGGIFVDLAERHQWEQRSVDLWNKREALRVKAQTKKNAKTGKGVSPADLAEDFDDLRTKSGSDGFMGEMLLSHVGKELTPKLRTAKGEINPRIPAHLAQAQWVNEPKTVFKVGQAYKQALDVNQKLADENGLNLFMSQWMEWDRIRNRFEPHENMFPGLSKLPAPSVEQMREVDRAHKETGHKTYGKNPEGSLKPTKPLKGSASRLGYLGVGGAAALGGAGALGSGGPAEAARQMIYPPEDER